MTYSTQNKAKVVALNEIIGMYMTEMKIMHFVNWYFYTKYFACKSISISTSLLIFYWSSLYLPKVILGHFTENINTDYEGRLENVSAKNIKCQPPISSFPFVILYF